MTKVTILFKDGTKEEFYATDSYKDGGAGLVYWELENGDIISFPSDDIKKIIEKFYES